MTTSQPGRRRLPTVLAALVAVFVLAAAGSATAAVRMATQDPHRELQSKPVIVYYTGDGTGFLSGSDPTPKKNGDGGIDWVVWNGTEGLGKGFNWVNDCRPDCAGGDFHRYRATIHVRRPRGGLFTRMTIVFRSGGHRAYDHRILERSGGYYYWGICGTNYAQPC